MEKELSEQLNEAKVALATKALAALLSDEDAAGREFDELVLRLQALKDLRTLLS